MDHWLVVILSAIFGGGTLAGAAKLLEVWYKGRTDERTGGTTAQKTEADIRREDDEFVRKRYRELIKDMKAEYEQRIAELEAFLEEVKDRAASDIQEKIVLQGKVNESQSKLTEMQGKLKEKESHASDN